MSYWQLSKASANSFTAKQGQRCITKPEAAKMGSVSVIRCKRNTSSSILAAKEYSEDLLAEWHIVRLPA